MLLRGDEAALFRARLSQWSVLDRTLQERSSASGLALRKRLSPVTKWENEALHLEFETEGVRVSAVAVLQAWKGGQAFVSLGTSGGWAPLPRDWLNRFGTQLEGVFLARSQKEQPLRVSNPLEQLRLEGLLETWGLEVPAPLQKLRAELERPEPSADLPLRGGVAAELREYQKAGVHWLSRLRSAGLGGILADDMGLGKTVQALSATRGRTLVVCPASVLVAWREQLARFAPQARVCGYHGSRRRLEPNADFTLTTYGVLRQDAGTLTTTPWETIVLDEAQAIKNPSSQVARIVHEFQAPFKIALSGTPIENSLSDLLSILQFACPGALTPEEAKALTPEQIRKRVRPFVLRRLKKEVAPELPARTEAVLRCTLSAPERTLYDGLAHATSSEVSRWMQERTGSAALQALEALLRLRQACNHGALVPGSGVDRATSSAKIELLIETLQTAKLNGHRSLVFSQWTSFLDLIEPRLRQAGLRFGRLDGQTRDRAAVVEEFQDEAGPDLLLVSLKAGGTGLTLTAADHVFLVDPWWNPAVEAQAADRAHRIGQNKPVFIYRLVAEQTIEERVLALQEEKRALVAATLGEEEGTSLPALEPSELLALLS